MVEKIPVPVTFNTHKHHFGFLLEQIDLWKKMEWTNVEPELRLIGENLTDLYTGKLTVNRICSECIWLINEQNSIDKGHFKEWLKPVDYRKITLADSSEWVIKEANDAERFIHIHPAKYSPFTIRVRAATLKTVLALIINSQTISENKSTNLLTVNHIRINYLQFSPVKSINPEEGILQLWRLFSRYLPGQASV